MYGKELLLDIHDADPKKFSRWNIKMFMVKLCDEINMVRMDLHFWTEREEDVPEILMGVSACQFISTSDILIHTIDNEKAVYLNVFTCKELDADVAEKVALEFFGGTVVQKLVVPRI